MDAKVIFCSLAAAVLFVVVLAAWEGSPAVSGVAIGLCLLAIGETAGALDTANRRKEQDEIEASRRRREADARAQSRHEA